MPAPAPAPIPKPPSPTHAQNSIETTYAQTTYRAGWLQVDNQWNLNGTSDYPVKVIGSYSLPLGGRQVNKEIFAQNANELTSVKNQLIVDMKAAINTEVSAQPKPSFTKNQLVETGNVSYR